MEEGGDILCGFEAVVERSLLQLLATPFSEKGGRMKRIAMVLTLSVLTMATVSLLHASGSTIAGPTTLASENTPRATPVSSQNANSIPNVTREGTPSSTRDLGNLIEYFHPQVQMASGSKQPYTVLALISDNDQPTFRSTLASYPDVATVDYYDATTSIPTLAQLLPYDCVITWPNYGYADAITTGDVLAQYVDAGGAVICGGFCWYLLGNHLDGEIMDTLYNPFTGLGTNHYSAASLGWFDPWHPIMAGVSAVSDQYRDSVRINPGADSVARWDDGEWFIATKGKVVGINAYPGDAGAFTGDLILIYYNAILWTQTAAEYAIFQDQAPYGTSTNQDILIANSLPFDVYGSSDVGAVDLSRYGKVIIASQQTNAFYATVSTNRGWFESYVSGGGVLEFHGACIVGDDWSGLPMPTGFTSTWGPYDSVSIHHPGHPIVLTPHIITDSELDEWNQSTHGYFINLLPGHDEVLRHDGANEPCLVVQPYGDGWVIATLNPLEVRYGPSYSYILENLLLWIPGASYALFQDHNPWYWFLSTNPNHELLATHGIRFDIYNSSHMGLVDLSMYAKVVTASAQPADFYDSLSMHRAWFESYMANGGILEFHGAPMFDWSGLPMPTGFTCDFRYSNSISIQAPGHPILTTPNIIGDVELDNWNYSTHGDLVSLIPGYTEVLRNDSTGAPTLAVLSYGSGWLIATMNTLEWAYYWGYSPILENVLLYMPTTGAEEIPSISALETVALHQNWPNPFESKTSINYSLPTPSQVSLKVYDKAGRLLRTLVDRMEGAGTFTVSWDGTDDFGRRVSNGVYFYSLKVRDTALTRKLVLLR